ncbi:MAG: nucleoside deaminase [Eubacteriales bacterium]
MQRALECARRAYENGDVPVGAVIVKDGEIIAEAYNERESTGRATAHAEILAIERASEKLGRWRLSDCELYVTLEPCTMCAGAILNARVGRLYYAVKDSNSGAFGSVLNLNSYPLLHKVAADVGLCEEESRELLSDFFKKRRA